MDNIEQLKDAQILSFGDGVPLPSGRVAEGQIETLEQGALYDGF